MWLPWLLLGGLLVGLVAWAAWPSGASSDAERARSLARELRCPDCESLSAAESHTASARAIRRDLRIRIAQGQSDAEIRQAYVERYGESILLRPEADGLGLLVWGVPIALLVVGAGGLAIALARWRAREPLRATEADEALVREVRAQDRQKERVL
jgi:cytochrome c-type biogenesis protein CcmH